MKNRLFNLLVVVLLAVGLGAWIVLPWYGVLVVAVALALWLLFTRGGRLALLWHDLTMVRNLATNPACGLHVKTD